MPKANVTLDSRRLLALRKRNCLTQEELADRSGRAKRSVENAESGKPVSLAIASDLASVLGVRPVDLFLDEANGDADADDFKGPMAHGTAPAMPTLLIGRDRDMSLIRDRLLSRLAESQVCGEMAMTIVRGWPGVGKTTVARAFAHDPALRRTFRDGILWTSLGQSPSIRSVLVSWSQSLDVEVAEGLTEQQISEQLTARLATKCILLIIDDVWVVAHVSPLLIGGRNCATLITTRLSSVAEALSPKDGDIHNLDVLSEEDAIELLNVLAPDVVKKFKGDCERLVNELECLPLALQVAGRLLRVEYRRTGDVRPLLDSLYVDAQQLLDAPVPADVHALVGDVAPTVVALLDRTTSRLKPQTRLRFMHLSPFAPKPAVFDMEALGDVWETDRESVRQTLNELIDFGLVEPCEQGRFQIHQILIKHARYLLKRE